MHKKKSFLLILIFLLSFKILSQEQSITNNLNQNLSTPVWDFNCESYALTGITKIQISKTSKGGLLKISIETTNPTFTIEGNLYVDLFDNTVLVCTDKKNRTVNGNEITSYYYFSQIEMNKLKKSDIEKIRFNIKGIKTKFSSQTGYFTAFNIKKKISTAFDKSKKSFDTAKEISELYK